MKRVVFREEGMELDRNVYKATEEGMELERK